MLRIRILVLRVTLALLSARLPPLSAATLAPAPLPEMFAAHPVTDQPGLLHLAPIEANLPGVSRVTMLNLRRSLVALRPAAGLVHRTMSGWVAHQEHLSGLLRIEAEDLGRRSWSNARGFDGSATLDVYAHDVHATGFRFDFAPRAPLAAKRSLVERLGHVLVDDDVAIDRRDWDDGNDRYVVRPNHPMTRDWGAEGRHAWEALPHLERIILGLPNVSAGRILLADGRGRVLDESEEIVRSNHLRVYGDRPATFGKRDWSPTSRLRKTFEDDVLRKARRLEVVYTHHLLPRGRPDVAIARLRTMTEALGMNAPLAAFDRFSNDRRELSRIFDFHREDFARELELRTAHRRTVALDLAIEALGRRLGDLAWNMDRPNREICEAELLVENSRRWADANRFSMNFGGPLPYHGAMSIDDAETNLQRVKRAHHRLW